MQLLLLNLLNLLKILNLKIPFSKYQGAGNDFVMIDNRNQSFVASIPLVRKLCDRHFGIGADGLILLQNDDSEDFRMIYFNSDGKPGSMCGNGGRCIVGFARDLGLIEKETRFVAPDGLHHAVIENDEFISLSMCDVGEIEIYPTHCFLDTGSPHHIEFVEEVNEVDVKNKGRKIRYGTPYCETGSNVNFVQIINPNTIKIRTYERGVEDETLACGTGITAAAIAAYDSGRINVNEVNALAVGGELKVSFTKNNGHYENIRLGGPAKVVFNGEIEI